VTNIHCLRIDVQYVTGVDPSPRKQKIKNIKINLTLPIKY